MQPSGALAASAAAVACPPVHAASPPCWRASQLEHCWPASHSCAAFSLSGSLGPCRLRSQSPQAPLACSMCVVQPQLRTSLATEVLVLSYGVQPPRVVQTGLDLAPFTVQLLDHYGTTGLAEQGGLCSVDPPSADSASEHSAVVVQVGGGRHQLPWAVPAGALGLARGGLPDPHRHAPDSGPLRHHGHAAFAVSGQQRAHLQRHCQLPTAAGGGRDCAELHPEGHLLPKHQGPHALHRRGPAARPGAAHLHRRLPAGGRALPQRHALRAVPLWQLRPGRAALPTLPQGCARAAGAASAGQLQPCRAGVQPAVRPTRCARHTVPPQERGALAAPACWPSRTTGAPPASPVRVRAARAPQLLPPLLAPWATVSSTPACLPPSPDPAVQFFSCPTLNTCSGGPLAGSAACAPGHQGPLCAVCMQDFYKFAGKCR